jgi:hypothetical protein
MDNQFVGNETQRKKETKRSQFKMHSQIDIRNKLSLTLFSLMASLSAPKSNSAVALLNAARPSMGRYCVPRKPKPNYHMQPSK